MKTLLKLGVGAGLAAGAYSLFVRPRMLRWGATPEERAERSPGARLIADGKLGSTMAVTIDAPPSAVWPWLVQMGYDRAGWYSWDRLDHAGIPSEQRLHPEWQSLTLGQRLQSTPDGKHWFEVAELEPQRILGLRVFMADGRQRDSGGPRPPSFSDSLWEFELRALPGDRTRLIVRVYTAARPRLPSTLLGFLFWEPAHFLMQTRQFTNLRRRTERALRDLRRDRALQPSTERPQPTQPRA